MIKRICIALFFISFLHPKMFSQCDFNANANGLRDSVEICLGDSVLLSIEGGCFVNYFCNDFNDSTLMSSWANITGGQFDNPCSPHSPDNSVYLWMGSDTAGPRFAETPPLDVSTGGQIEFEMRYSIQSASSPCEGPDQYNEGVALQYALINDTTWTTFLYWAPNGDILTFIPTATTPGSSGQTPFTIWNNFSYNVPTQLQSSATRFRWIQQTTTSPTYDHWGLDNVCISHVGPQSQYWWAHNVTGNTPHYVIPQTTTTYTAYLSDGIDTVSSSVVVVVNQPPQMSISSLAPNYCISGDSSVMVGTPPGGVFSGAGINGNVFYPTLAGQGTHDITYTYHIIGNSVGQTDIFNDDFSTDKGWTGYGPGGWERAVAAPSSGCSGNAGPSTDHSPSTDSLIIGTYIGGCYPTSLNSTYWLTSPIINCTGCLSVELEYWRWAGCESASYDHIIVEAYDGTDWTNVWLNSSSFSDATWTQQTHNVSQMANNNPNFKVRFGIGGTDGSVVYIGWNIDDVVIRGIGPVIDTLCSFTATATTTVLEEPVSDFNMPDTACIDEPFVITYLGSAPITATYTWAFDNGNILSGSGQGPYQLVWDTTGIFNCTLTVSDSNCASTTTASVFIEDCTGMDTDLNTGSFKLYPNPNNGNFMLELNEKAMITIYNVLGTAVFESSLPVGQHPFHLYRFAKGLYVLKVEKKKGTSFLKIIIR